MADSDDPHIHGNPPDDVDELMEDDQDSVGANAAGDETLDPGDPVSDDDNPSYGAGAATGAGSSGDGNGGGLNVGGVGNSDGVEVPDDTGYGDRDDEDSSGDSDEESIGSDRNSPAGPNT